MVDIEMKGLKEVCEKYPQYADRIANAFTTVLADDERDIEAELYGCEIEEEDIFKIVDSVMEVKFGNYDNITPTQQSHIAIKDIKNVRLLSLDEANQLPKEILESDGDWWLNTPVDSLYVTCVSGYGDIHPEGVMAVGVDNFGVRPVLDFSESLSYKQGDEFVFGDTEFVVIFDGVALSKTVKGEFQFYDSQDSKDVSTKYEKSNAKKYLDKWFEEQKEIQKQREDCGLKPLITRSHNSQRDDFDDLMDKWDEFVHPIKQPGDW